MRSSACGGFSIFFFTLHLLLCSSVMARSNRPRPLFTAAAARARSEAESKARDVAITLGAGGAGDDGVHKSLASSAQDNPSFGHVGSTGNAGRGGGDGPGGEDPETTAMNLDPSLCYAPLNYSDEETSMTEFINAAPFYSPLQDFAPPSMAELFNDSSVEEEMKGGVAARPCSDSLQNAADIELENYIKLRIWEIWGSNDVGENIQPKFPTKNGGVD